MRRFIRPFPKYNIDIAVCGRRSETGDDDAADPPACQICCDSPTRRGSPEARYVFPSAGKGGEGDLRVFADSRVSQINNIRAVDIISAKRKRLEFVTKALLRLKQRGLLRG